VPVNVLPEDFLSAIKTADYSSVRIYGQACFDMFFLKRRIALKQ
jgi:hypothetical protein